MFKQSIGLWMVSLLILTACSNSTESGSDKNLTGEVERLSTEINKLIPENAHIEILAEGFVWSEGPLWLEDQQKLIFTDVPNNIVYEYTDADSLQVYLTPSGLTIESPNAGNSGANGLLLNKKGDLVLCQHGDRRIARMRAPLNKPVPIYETVTSEINGLRYNSPNDAVYDARGNLYFTDPPYGLNDQDNDSLKEMPSNGVYILNTDNEVRLLTGELTRPNGIGLSPDESKLYVANSDPESCLWMVYDLTDKKTLENGKVFFDATSMYNGKNGLADGLKVDKNGNIFATGPGGVLVFSQSGDHLGTIKTGYATANCAFNDDESVLYMTAHNYLMRIKLKENEQ